MFLLHCRRFLPGFLRISRRATRGCGRVVGLMLWAAALGGCAGVHQGQAERQGAGPSAPTGTAASVPVAAATRPATSAPVAATTWPSPADAPVGQWVSLFDGQTLNGWRVLDEGAFAGHADVRVADGAIVLERGRLQTGIGWQGDFPRDEYEVSLEATRVSGSDFFCGMTFPVGPSPCTLIVGGWGGTVVGLSNVDDLSAAENETTLGMSFENGRWYEVRLRVTKRRITAWIDGRQVIDLSRPGRRFTVWWEQEPARPFGFATWDTAAALRHIKLQRLENSDAEQTAH